MSLYVNIKKRYGDFMLESEFEAKDEVIALLGASGSGKSLTLKCIAGIEKPDEGVIVANGKILYDSKRKINLSPQKRNIGLLFQGYGLFPNMTAKKNIFFAAKDKEYAQELIKRFHVGDFCDKYPNELSGGQQQRVALARMLVTRPEIVMLDEPFSALDSYLRWQLEQEVSLMLRDFRKTAVLVSHNRDEVYRICDSIAVINNGRTERIDEKWEVFKNPITKSAAVLTGCKNISHAKKIGDRKIFCTDWGVELTSESQVPDDIVYVGIRAHYIYQTDIPGENTFIYTILEHIENTFSDVYMVGVNKGVLRIEVPKTKCGVNVLDKKYICMPANDILCLK